MSDQPREPHNPPHEHKHEHRHQHKHAEGEPCGCGHDHSPAPAKTAEPRGLSLPVMDAVPVAGNGQHKHETVATPAAGHSHAEHTHNHAHDHDGIACACGHEHGADGGHSHSGVGLNLQLAFVLPAAIGLLVLAFALQAFGWGDKTVADAMGLLAAAVAGGPILWSAVKGLSRGQTNVNELVALAIVGAVSMGLFIEAGLVALILQIGALIEQVATESARNAVLALQDLSPKHARVKHGDHDHVVSAEQVKVGDVLVVQPGERIAADGQIVSGATSIDESMVTGESVPVEKTTGAQALAGTINKSGSIEVKVARVGEQSALGQTIALVRRAQQFQPKIIRAADKFFAFYTPIILGLSLLVLATTGDVRRMVTMWVVGCPCAMLLASPLAIVVALARASRSGIQVKAGPFVEASANLDTVVFDKTGTLTTGKFIVSKVQPVAGLTEQDVLRLAATIENRSSHPLARSIVAHAAQKGVRPVAAADVKVIDGLGVQAVIDGHLVTAGSAKILKDHHAAEAARLDAVDSDLPVVPVYLVSGEKLIGVIHLTDEIRPEAERAVRRLRSQGIKRVVMLTGDRRRTAEMVARAVGCDEVFAELLPAQKVSVVRQLQAGGRGVCMVGDGINDAPSLAAAHVGVAMGLRGTDAAMEAADAVLLKDDLTRIPLLIYLARQTRFAIYQNLAFSLAFTGVVEAAVALNGFSSFGKYAVVAAAAAHVLGVVVIAVNSVRLAGTAGRNTPKAAKPTTPAGDGQIILPVGLTPALQTV